MHALGFSSSRYAYFWDHTNGKPRTQRCCHDTHAAFYPSGVPTAGDTSNPGNSVAANYISGDAIMGNILSAIPKERPGEHRFVAAIASVLRLFLFGIL